jgi:hypothetical protein
VRVAGSSLAGQRDQDGTERRDGKRNPAADVQPFTGEQNGCDGEKHGKRADHQRGMGNGGEGESLELDEVLHWHFQRGRGKNPPPFADAKPGMVKEREGQQPGTCESERNKTIDATGMSLSAILPK